jgi:hypothetical protein
MKNYQRQYRECRPAPCRPGDARPALLLIAAALFLACSSEERGVIVTRQHCYYTWDPCPSAVLSCAQGVLRSELGLHSMKVWCEPADGGAK